MLMTPVDICIGASGFSSSFLVTSLSKASTFLLDLNLKSLKKLNTSFLEAGGFQSGTNAFIISLGFYQELTFSTYSATLGLGFSGLTTLSPDFLLSPLFLDKSASN